MSSTDASSVALTKRSSDSALMPPPPPPKRIKRPPKVLDEDTYTSALSHIIAGDFFPGLLETETQQEYLDALDAGDEEWIDEAGKRVREAMTPVPGNRRRRNTSMTPQHSFGGDTPTNWRGETPRGVATPAPLDRRKNNSLHGANKEEEVDLNLSLSAFQAKYTSEDNESFNSVLDRQNNKRAEKYAWLHNGNRLPSARLIAQAVRQQKLLPSSSDDSSSSQALTLRPSNDLDLRPASIAPQQQQKSTRDGQRNAFMFGPEDITVTHPEHETLADAAAARSNAPPKAVRHAATRMPLSAAAMDAGDDTSSTVPESPSLSAIDAAITGRPYRREPTVSAAPSTAPCSETPRVNGYSYVDAEPSAAELRALEDPLSAPSPRDREAEKAALLQSMRESGGGGGVNPFSIATQSKREALHHRMVDKNFQARRRPTAGPASSSPGLSPSVEPNMGRTPTPRFASGPKMGGGGRKAQGALTPAARLLYDKVGRTPAREIGGSAFGERRDGKKGSFTPTPVRAKRAG